MLNRAPFPTRALASCISSSLIVLLGILVTQSAFGALATDAITSTDRSSSGASISSPSFSTKSGNELLLAFISTDAQSSGITVTGVSGAGLTWALVRRTNGQLGTAEVWRAFAPTLLSAVTVKATLSQSVAASITIVTCTGVDTSGTNGSGAIGNTNGNNASSGAPSVSLVTTRDGSWVFGVGNDWDNATARTPGTNQSLLHQYLASVGDTYWVQKQNAPTSLSGTQVFINDTAPTADRFNLTIIEVLAATGGATTGSITGTISPAPNGTQATVALSQNGTTVATATVTPSGSYSFSNVANGTYTLTPSETGFTFSPANQSVTVNGNATTVPVFTATALLYTVSGTISPAPNGSVATVSLSQNGTTIATTTVGSNGSYSFSNVANGTYTATPSENGFTFSPTSQSVTVNGGPATVPVFTATALVYAVSGTISPAPNGSIATVSLSQNGTTIATTTVGSDGSYSFNNLSNGTYTLTPSETGFTFSPASQSVTVNGGPATVPVFIGTAVTASGIHLIQKNVNGNESTSPNISATFPSNNIAGNFLIVTGTAARPASTLTITDTAGNTYVPALGPVTDSNQSVTAYIWYVPSCKGGANTVTITPPTADALEIHISEWSGLATSSSLDQTASATGTGTAASSGSKTTAANGELVFGYTFLSNTASTGSGFTGISLVNGDMDEYQIQSAAGPVAATFTQTSGNWLALMATFAPAGGGIISSGSISGNISPASLGSGTVLTLSGSNSTATADANGNYGFTNVANGTYTVTPSQAGVMFTPASQSATVSGNPVSNLNFTAQSTATGILAIDANVSKDTTTKASTATTPAFSTNAGNELLLAFVSGDYLSGANTTVTGVTGGSLTWVLVKRTNAQSGTAEIWRAFSPTPLSNVTVTATLSQSVLSSITVMTFTGVDISGTNGSGAIGAVGTANKSSGAPTASLTTTRNNSWVFGVGNDYDNAIARTVGSGQTMVHQYLTSSGDTYWVQRQTNTTPVSGSIVNINDTTPNSDRYNLSLAEILPSPSTGGGTPPIVSITSPVAFASVTGSTAVAANASGQGSAITGVQFLLDGANLGAQVTTSPYSLIWDTTTATGGAHSLSAIAYNSAGLSAIASSITVTVDNSANLTAVGSWSSPVNLPAVAVNLVLLKNNTLLFYQDGSTPTVWDYMNDVFTSVPGPANLFCSGQTMLADGRILIVGGYGGSGNQMGIPNAEIFDPSNDTWTVLPKMAYSRWYPTATTLSDGRVIVMGGWQTTNNTNAGIPEIYDPAANTWTKLTNANNPFETYPFIYQLSDGRLIHVNGSEYPTVTDILNLTSQSWSTVDANIKDGGSSVMYLQDKIMKAGSATDSQSTGNSLNTTYVLDMTQPSPAWKQTASMAYPRSFLNLTELPDGTVLATGGETDKNGGNVSNAVYAAELWSPTTQTWTTMSAMHTPREYHGTALLLPDGRVLESGMGADFGNVPDQLSAEFFSPPYLFKGARPTVTQSPAQITYGQNFFVGTPDGSTITTAVLVRTGAATHFFNMNARYVPVTFTQTTGGLNIVAPANGYLAPPGYYMLFLVNSNGVPSIAPFVQIQ